MAQLRIIIIFLLCTFSMTSYGQLAPFNINAVVSNETCTNNGKIVVTSSGTVAGAEIVYRLYLAPDFDTSIAETAGNSFTSLGAGSYRIVATQSANNLVITKSLDVVIQNEKEILDFELSEFVASECSATGKIIVDVLAGNAMTYEIISGPEIRPLQSSNEFAGLASGTYIIRVFDNCGDALSKTYTLVLGSNNLDISDPELPDVYTSCTTIDIKNIITPDVGAILYPLNVNYTVFAPDGSVSQNYTQTISTGPETGLELTQQITLFANQLFTVKIVLTDSCNNVFTEEFQINPNPKLTFVKFQNPCGQPYFAITIKNYLPPFTLNFTSPAEFNPLLFNPTYPGPFNDSSVVFGDENNTVPFGNYAVSATDSCNRSANLTFSIQEKPIEPTITAVNNGCDSPFGTITIKIPNDGTIVSVFLTSAPASYQGTLPQNMFSFVNSEGVFVSSNLPIGDYVFIVVDNCDNESIIEVSIPAFVFGELEAEARPSCSPVFGSVKLSTSNGPLVTVNITAAPPTYLETLPKDVSVNVSADGNFYMTNLPAGTYTFTTIDLCGYTSQVTVDILGYNSSSEGFSITRKCGAFDIILNDLDETIANKTFWLQKFFPATNSWGNPYTGAQFTEGAIPNATTAKKLVNPGTLLNIFLTGEFRIIKVFDTFNNGNPNGKCTDIYAEFIVSSELLIAGVYNLNCIGGSGPNTVVINVIGVEPLNFQITAPYFQDNGSSYVFEDLDPGIYNILATDACGNIKNISVEVGTLLPLARASKPEDLFECRTDDLEFGTFSLINQTPEVLGNQKPSDYLVTYHLTQADADTGENDLPDGYTNISNPQIIYVRVEHKALKLCYATTSFTLLIGTSPVLEPISEAFICEGFSAKLTAESGFDAYEWSTGETTESIIVSEPGTYTLTVKNIYGEYSCDSSQDFIVVNSGLATIQKVETSDWTSSNNSVTILVSGIGNYIYSLDNVNFQTSNTFTNLLPGFYTAYVKDKNGCGTVSEDFALLNYPKYFTPNGDGYNDTWQIKFSDAEPKMNVDIFDRYGKFIIRLKGGEVGWDGTYNGNELFSTDYWFVVTREDGKEYRGHFSLKR